MEICEMKNRCEFFKNLMPSMPEKSNLLKNYFCMGNNTECARYKFLRINVNPDKNDKLLPNQVDYLAERLCIGEFF
jgi:hypothetical protein